MLTLTHLTMLTVIAASLSHLPSQPKPLSTILPNFNIKFSIFHSLSFTHDIICGYKQVWVNRPNTWWASVCEEAGNWHFIHLVVHLLDACAMLCCSADDHWPMTTHINVTKLLIPRSQFVDRKQSAHICSRLTLWLPLLPYGYSYKASYARPG